MTAGVKGSTDVLGTSTSGCPCSKCLFHQALLLLRLLLVQLLVLLLLVLVVLLVPVVLLALLVLPGTTSAIFLCHRQRGGSSPDQWDGDSNTRQERVHW